MEREMRERSVSKEYVCRVRGEFPSYGALQSSSSSSSSSSGGGGSKL